MKIYQAFILVVLTVFATHPARAAGWQIVASPNSGTQANSLASTAAAGDDDVWAVGWAYNQSAGAYRTLIEHWNGTSWLIVSSPNAANGYNLLNGIAVVSANDV